MSKILPSAPERPRVLQHVSGNVRRLRHAAGLSQEALARAADVSRRMIVGIETGEANVSLSTLDRIAAALGVLFSDLVQAPTAPDRLRIDAVAWLGRSPASRAVLLATAPARREVELWSWVLQPGERYAADGSGGEGWHVMVYVTEGELILEWPDGEHRIAAGDFHAFPCDRPCAYANRSEAVVRFIRTVSY